MKQRHANIHGVVRPKTYDANLRAGLVRAAADRMAVGGPDGISLRELAANQGTSTNAIYAMFGGKSQLVAAVLDEADASFTAAQREALGEGNTIADLHRLAFAYREWALQNPTLYAAMFGHSGLVSVHQGELVASGRTPESMGPLLHIVGNLIVGGRLRDEGVLPVATSLWACVHGIVSLEIAVWAGTAVAESLFLTHLVSLEHGWMTALGRAESRALRGAGPEET